MSIDVIVWFIVSGVIIVALIVIGKLLDKWITGMADRWTKGLSTVEDQLRRLSEFMIRQEEKNKAIDQEFKYVKEELKRLSTHSPSKEQK